MASLRLNRGFGTSEFLLWGRGQGQGKTRSVLVPGKGEMDVGQSWQEGQEHPREPRGDRARVMLLEVVGVAIAMAFEWMKLTGTDHHMDASTSSPIKPQERVIFNPQS